MNASDSDNLYEHTKCHHTSCGRSLHNLVEEFYNHAHDNRGRFTQTDERFAPVSLAEAAKAHFLKDHHLAAQFTHDQLNRVVANPEVGRRIAEAYKNAKTYDPAAEPAYHQLAREVHEQYRYLTKTVGVKVEVVHKDPYANVNEMVKDVRENGRLKVLATATTGSHPIFTNQQNDEFRAVHDYFGHAATGKGFDRHGEEASFLSHSEMFGPLARRALTTETRGQNAAVVWDKHGFPAQKMTLLPEEFSRPDSVKIATHPVAIAAAAYDITVAPLKLVDIDAYRAELGLQASGGIAVVSEDFYNHAHDQEGRFTNTGTGESRIGQRSLKGGAGQTSLAFDEISKEGLQSMVARMHAVGALPKEIKTADEAANYIAHNVTEVYNKVSPANAAAWKEWYVGANKLGQDLSGPDLPHHAANATIAALSPGTDWNVNIAQTRAAVAVLRANRPLTESETTAANTLVAESFGRQQAAWLKKSGVAQVQLEALKTERSITSDAKALKQLDTSIAAKTRIAAQPEPKITDLPHFKSGDKISEVSNAASGYIIRAQSPNPVVHLVKINADGTYNDSEVAMTKMGKAQAAGWQSYENIAKMTSIYRDPSMENISNQLGQAHKVRSFFNNINDPHNPAGDVTIDCFDTETEVLSQRGWLRYDEVTSDDLVYSYNADGLGEWANVNYVFVGHYEGPMITMTGKTHSLNAVCTPHHKWIARDRNRGTNAMVCASDLRGQHALITAAPAMTGIGLPINLAAALGWIMSEGHYPSSWKTAIKISQSHRVNPDKCVEIERVLTDLGCEWKCVPNRPQTKDEFVYIMKGEWVRTIRNEFMPNKTIAPWVIAAMTKEDADAFLSAYVDGDGWRSKTGQCIATKSVANADAIEAIAALAGYYTYRLMRPDGMMHITLRKPRAVRVTYLDPFYTDYNGLIWCPNTDNGTAFFRRGGTTFMSGQTHAYGLGLAKPLSISHPWIKSGKLNMTNTGGSVKDGTSGAYALFHEGYRRAAVAAGVEPREMQSITWEAWRGMHTTAERAANVKAISKGAAL